MKYALTYYDPEKERDNTALQLSDSDMISCPSLRAHATQSIAIYASIRRAAGSPQPRQSRHSRSALAVPQKTHAFTLIELSIVLVIIGLIIGGVLVGQDLIKAAKARGVLGQMQGYEIAHNTFKLKYNCLPGDCNNANTFGLGPDGNGDKALGSTTSASFTTNGCVTDNGWSCTTLYPRFAGRVYAPWYELQQFWTHLGSAGLLGDTFTSMTQANNPGASVVGYNFQSVPEAMQLDGFFPKAATNKSYILPLMWNNRLYLRTGMIAMISTGPMFAQGNRDSSQGAALSGMQMKYIHDKMGYELISNVDGNNYPNSALAGQRVFPSRMLNYNQAVEVYPPDHASLGRDSICFQNSETEYRLDGYCDLFWQIN